jgi:hypothetical protein
VHPDPIPCLDAEPFQEARDPERKLVQIPVSDATAAGLDHRDIFGMGSG